MKKKLIFKITATTLEPYKKVEESIVENYRSKYHPRERREQLIKICQGCEFLKDQHCTHKSCRTCPAQPTQLEPWAFLPKCPANKW